MFNASALNMPRRVGEVRQRRAPGCGIIRKKRIIRGRHNEEACQGEEAAAAVTEGYIRPILDC